MTIFLTIHSINRWLIVVASLIAIYFLAKDILAKTSISKNARIFSSLFGGLMDLQLLLGLVAFALPNINGGRNDHAGIMFAAVIVSHLPAIFKKKNPANYPAIMLGAIVLALVLIVVGIVPIGGMVRWTSIFGI